MTRWLFVYGTLRRSVPHPMARWLARRARYCGVATVKGVLYEVDGYPVLVPHPDAGRRVVGDLYALPATDADAILRRLDAYEGCDMDAPGYRRVVLPVVDSRGRRYIAWVYIWTGSLERARPIPGGDYLHR